MDENNIPSYTPAEGQQVPPAQYAADQQPQYAQPQYAQYQQPQYTQPQYTQPQYTQPQYAQYQQPQYQQPQYAQYQQPQYAQPQQAPVKRSRVKSGGPVIPNLPKWLIPAAIGAVALIVVIILIASLAGGGAPENKVPDAAMNTLSDLRSNPILQTVEETANSGSIAVSVDLSDVMEEMAGMSMSAEGQLKFYFDLDGSKTALELTADVLGNEMDAAFFLGADEIVLSSEWLLEGDAYGMSIKDLEKNLADSIFFDEDSDFYIGDEAVEMMELLFESAGSMEKSVTKLYDDGSTLAEKYIELLIKSAFKYGESETEKDEIKIGGEKTKVNVVSLKLDGEAIINIGIAMLEEVEGDKKLEKFLDSVVTLVDDNPELFELYSELYGMDIDSDDMQDAIDEMYDSIGDALEEMEEALEDADDMDVTLKFEFYLKGSNLLGFKYDDGYQKMKLIIGPDLSNPAEISFEMTDYYGTYTFEYKVKEDTDEAFEASIYYCDNPYYDYSIEFVVDKEKGEWEFTMDDTYDLIGVAGEYTEEKGVYTITFTDATEDGESIEEAAMVLSAITITVDTDDDVPKAPSYTEILSLDEDEIYDLVEEVYAIVEDLMYSMY